MAKAPIGVRTLLTMFGNVDQALAQKASAHSIPLPANTAPKSESTGGSIGAQPARYALEDHQHPRLTSTTMGTLGADSRATITFTRTFTNPPGMTMIEIGGSTTASAQPALFKVESWIQAGGVYTGCVVRGWRAQAVPQNLVTLLVTAVFNLFAASASGTTFSCIAVARSDV